VLDSYLGQVTTRELERTLHNLRLRRRRAVEALALALLAAAAAGALVPFSLRLGIPIAIGAAVEGAIAFAVHADRAEYIAQLALDPGAYTISEVERYGRRLAAMRERERLAAWIHELLASVHLPGNYYLADRVAHFTQDLDMLARELASSAVRVQPSSAVMCQRLLTHAVESPLYNPRVPRDELRAAIQRIRRGIQVS
jgi:hypothetical protein